MIGSGFGGLAVAVRLLSAGHEVTVLEQCDAPGGRALVFTQDGFTFDAGPTIITAPPMIDALFAVAGRRRADYVTLVPLDPFYTVRFDDGASVRWSANDADIERQVEVLSAADVTGLRRFLAASERIFNEAYPLIDRPFESLRDMGRALPALVRARAWMSVAGLAAKHVRDPRLRQLLSFHPLLIGGNPFDASAIYALIHALERRWGVWYVKGGTGALVRALVRLIEELGGRVRLGCRVDEILVAGAPPRARGVRLVTGERVEADVVVSNADVASTYLRLLPPPVRRVNRNRRYERMRYSMSVFVLYFGTDRRYDDVGHHEILMGPRYRGLLDDVFHRRVLADDCSLYLHRPTATDPALAPPGCDAWYALSPVPHLGGNVDWARVAPGYRDRIVRRLESRRLPGLSRHIVTERWVDPRHFRDVLGSHLGSAFSVEPTLLQSAWFRPHNESEDVRDLYLTGAGTHPGAGIPGVLGSAKIVADLVAARHGTPPRRTAVDARAGSAGAAVRN